MSIYGHLSSAAPDILAGKWLHTQQQVKINQKTNSGVLTPQANYTD
jgi:hypothetical protein